VVAGKAVKVVAEAVAKVVKVTREVVVNRVKAGAKRLSTTGWVAGGQIVSFWSTRRAVRAGKAVKAAVAVAVKVAKATKAVVGTKTREVVTRTKAATRVNSSSRRSGRLCKSRFRVGHPTIRSCQSYSRKPKKLDWRWWAPTGTGT